MFVVGLFELHKQLL